MLLRPFVNKKNIAIVRSLMKENSVQHRMPTYCGQITMYVLSKLLLQGDLDISNNKI